MTVTIIPIADHEHYSVNGHQVHKDSSERYRSMTPLSDTELKAFNRYRRLVIDNQRFRRHIKSTYKD